MAMHSRPSHRHSSSVSSAGSGFGSDFTLGGCLDGKEMDMPAGDGTSHPLLSPQFRLRGERVVGLPSTAAFRPMRRRLGAATSPEIRALNLPFTPPVSGRSPGGHQSLESVRRFADASPALSDSTDASLSSICSPTPLPRLAVSSLLASLERFQIDKSSGALSASASKGFGNTESTSSLLLMSPPAIRSGKDSSTLNRSPLQKSQQPFMPSINEKRSNAKLLRRNTNVRPQNSAVETHKNGRKLNYRRKEKARVASGTIPIFTDENIARTQSLMSMTSAAPYAQGDDKENIAPLSLTQPSGLSRGQRHLSNKSKGANRKGDHPIQKRKSQSKKSTGSDRKENKIVGSSMRMTSASSVDNVCRQERKCMEARTEESRQTSKKVLKHSTHQTAKHSSMKPLIPFQERNLNIT